MIMIYLSLLEDDRDRALFNEIHKHYEKKMYLVARSILGSHHKAEEAVQDSFMKIIKHFSKCKEIPRNELDGWIVIIVKNTARDYLRRDNRLEEMDDSWEIVSSDDTESVSRYNRLVEIILAMPENYRGLLEMKYVLEWQNVEIARHYGMTENAIAARIFRARKKLLQQLEKEGYDLDEHLG